MKKFVFAITVLIAVYSVNSIAQSGYSSTRQAGRTIYVSPQGYLDGKSFNPVYKSMSDAFKVVRRGDTIKLYGKLRESGLVTPKEIADVTILGMGTRVRPGNTSTPNGLMGGAADWSDGSQSNGLALLTVISSGWSFENVSFGGLPRGASIILDRNGSTHTANHTQFIACAFSGGLRGIEDRGGNANVGIYNNQFYGYGTAIANTSTSQALPLMWEIIGNRFVENTVHIKLPLSNSIVRDNVVFETGYLSKSRVMLDLSGGKNNAISNNTFAGSSTARNEYLAGTNDAWGSNFYSNMEVYGVPK